MTTRSVDLLKEGDYTWAGVGLKTVDGKETYSMYDALCQVDLTPDMLRGYRWNKVQTTDENFTSIRYDLPSNWFTV